MATETVTEDQEKEAKDVEKADETLNEEKKSADTSQLTQAATDKLSEINQSLSTIPDKIEEVCVDIRKKLDMLLGKVELPTSDPNSFEFDAQTIIKPLQAAIVNPLMTVLQPLSLVAGKLPIISDLASIFTAIGNQSTTRMLSKEELKKLIPSIPEMPSALFNEIGKIQMNIVSLCIQIPMILINLIFAMINVIYSKLKIITSVIPLGSFFPLSLIPNAINAVPKAVDFIKNTPGEIYKLIEGTIKQKIAEAQAFGVTQSPNADVLKSKAADAAKGVANKAKGEADKANNSSVTQQKTDAQIKNEAEKAKNDQNALAPAPPVESTILEIQKNPPIPEKTKSYDEVVDFWKGKFGEIKLFGFEQNQKFNSSSFADELNYAYFVELDDPWESLKNSVEFESLKNPEKAGYYFKETYCRITGSKGYGYWMSQMTNYSQFDLEKDSKDQYKIVQKRNNSVGRYSFCAKEYIDERRITPGNDQYKDWLDGIQSSSKYKNPKYKEQIDKGIAKMPSLLGKYYFFDESQLPKETQLMFIGKNKVF